MRLAVSSGDRIVGSVLDLGRSKAAETELYERQQVLSKLISGVARDKLLADIASIAERSAGGARCGIIVAEGDAPRLVAAPNLPLTLKRALERIGAEDSTDPVAHALAAGECVILDDLEAAADWSAKEPALAAGLHACWICPILFQSEIRGVMSLYLPEARKPQAHEMEKLRASANLASATLQLS